MCHEYSKRASELDGFFWKKDPRDGIWISDLDYGI
jgi:hypothetical protein